MEQVCVGTAGWSIHSRHAPQFPGDGSHLERYAARLNCVEINSSFYKPHRIQTYERWAASVPQHFRFSVKLPKLITHQTRLTDAEAPLERFLGEAGGLGDKLAVLLVQLPPSLAFDRNTAETFFHLLRTKTSAGIALEPRHASWFAKDTESVLVDHRISRVAADPPRHEGGDRPGGLPGLRYYRFHGSPKIYYSDYESAKLREIAARLVETAGAETWCIFDNTAASHALGNAASVADMVFQITLSSR